MFTGDVCLILRLMFWLGVVLGATFAIAEERQAACDNTGTALAAAIEPLKALCPSPSSGTSPECIEALDARYWNRPVQCNVHSNLGEGFGYRPQWWPQPRNDTVVWRQVFEDPLALRREVEAATRDPACRLRDEVGDEHWVDADRAEHWIALDGTEWILLPVGAPFPDDAE